MIERIHTSERMSRIVKHNNTVYLCGQVGDGDSIQEQTKDCLGRIDKLLDEAGSSRDRILQAIVWLKDMSEFDAFNELWDAWVPEGHAPARACGRADMAWDIDKVEIIITAACD